MVWQFWGRAAEGVLSTAQDVFIAPQTFARTVLIAQVAAEATTLLAPKTESTVATI